MKSIYQDTITRVQTLLEANDEWKDRYKNYVETILAEDTHGDFSEAQKQFAVPAPFHLYMPLSTAVNECSSRRTVFELRFHGQSVAKVIVDNRTEKKVSLQVKETAAIYNVIEKTSKPQDAKHLANLANKGSLDWHSAEAKEFRRIYADLEHELTSDTKLRLKGQPEHDMESALLQNYAKKQAEGKEITFIQPVTMFDTRARFQMPTPIRASDVKNGIDTLAYSGKSGGGIDILARVGRGRNTTLAVMELKDENTVSESPEKVICQAIAYATFLRKLLRSESGQKWWNFFGFSGDIPRKVNIKAVVVMPLKDKKGNINEQTKGFIDFVEMQDNKILSVPNTGDQIELGYVFRDGQSSRMSV